MGVFKDWIKKITGSSRSEEISPPPPPNLTTSEIEKKIDDVVASVLLNDEKRNGIPDRFFYKGLYGLKADLKYWQAVIKAICFAESSFNPNEKYFESTMGYYSCGLMQLSYEDCRFYDFYLSREKKEIFDIEKNIQLGMIILNHIVEKHGHYIFNNGNYWAVLQPKNKRHQIFLKKFNQYMGGV